LWRGLEPLVVRAAAGLVGVSARTCEEVLARTPGLPPPALGEVPLGGEPRDFDAVRRLLPPNRHFDPTTGFHLCYVGTLLPLGFETLRAVLLAVAHVRRARPELVRGLTLRFFGTSNQTAADAPARVLPLARELGVAEHVVEVAPRIDYLEALTVLTDATAILAMGSSERHYTASKLYPGLLARRPLLAVYHEASLVSTTLARWTRPPSVRLVTYGDVDRAERRVDEVAAALTALLADPGYDPSAVDLARIVRSAQDLAGELGRVLEAAIGARERK
ncbi:MAG: hypothetical protein KIT58_03310, partial [Planctomycetota bacterium]|nr:hypothetical protein [Planctomycetota bacterium]